MFVKIGLIAINFPLNTAFAVSKTFWKAVFLFPFVFLSFRIFFFSFSFWLHPQCMKVPRLGVESAAHITAQGNTGSLTHWARPGIEPTSSWMLSWIRFRCATTGTPSFLVYWPIVFLVACCLVSMCLCFPHFSSYNWFLLQYSCDWKKILDITCPLRVIWHKLRILPKYVATQEELIQKWVKLRVLIC